MDLCGTRILLAGLVTIDTKFVVFLYMTTGPSHHPKLQTCTRQASILDNYAFVKVYFAV